MFFTWVVAVYSLNACISKNDPDLLSTDRVKRLLALDTGKVWLRTAMSVNGDDVDLLDCELQNLYSFDFIDDSDTVFYIGANTNCSQLTADTLNRWSWQVIANIREEFLDSLELIDASGNITVRKITELTSNNLSWEFIEGDGEISESFVWRKDE